MFSLGSRRSSHFLIHLLAKSYSLIMSLGLAVPKDIAIISISDGIYPYLTHPKVTHVKDSGNKMGQKACKLLLNTIEGGSKKNVKHVLVSTKLLELESV